ncbi:plasmid maintenance protein [Borrelia sp. P9F1]|uniref:plasmid maintenance protein n=1 Tax=Borrelia sp. P9F1 TaxID=3058374 RepID=UPI00264A06F2|nr:plasmid maintenance protein [Borrelia sp. P9F1]WKC58472.1 plasmid maintenance protein [Borrelia sp. P9F1]
MLASSTIIKQRRIWESGQKFFTCFNECQHKLIVLVSTLSFMNKRLKKYTQGQILRYFNNNLQQNGQKQATLKRLQKYLKRLGKEFGVTINYYQHLGKNLGTEIRYTLRYSKKECYNRINRLFAQKKLNRFQDRFKEYNEKIVSADQRGSVVKGECINNSNNKEEERRDRIAKNESNSYRVTKYITRCGFKTDLPSFILKLKVSDDIKINHLRNLKRFENDSRHISIKTIENKLKPIIKSYAYNPKHLYKFNIKGCYYTVLREIRGDNLKLNEPKAELRALLKERQAELVKQGYYERELDIEIGKIYESYKTKPHFILQNDKYKDLDLRIARIKKRVQRQIKEDVGQKQKETRDNIFSILLEQLKHKVDINKLRPALKRFIDSKDKLSYSKMMDNSYYYELLDRIGQESTLREINIFGSQMVNNVQIRGL